MESRLRQSQALLHTWAGLLFGWLMFIIFLFGTVAFFTQEISAWMRPELGRGAVTDTALDKIMSYLAETAPGATAWTITLPPPRGGEPVLAAWQGAAPPAAGSGETAFDPASGDRIMVRDTRGGGFPYSFHYNLHYMPWWLARYLVCIASVAMLVALVTGVITHKKILVDFFTLRPGRGQRSWLDAHNLTAVLALPFHVMITYTGLVTLLFTLMPWAVAANFPDPAAFRAALRPPPPPAPMGEAAPLLPLPDLIRRSGAASGDPLPYRITIHHPGDAAAVAAVIPRVERLGDRYGALLLDAVDGRPLHRPPAAGPGLATHGVMTDLHAARFADPLLRWLYFLSGVAGTAMIATGLVLWTVKRRGRLPDPAQPPAGFRLVERLNIAVMAGAPAGLAVYFLANRLLPPAMAGRAEWEIHCLFLAWAVLAAWTLARPPRRAWVEGLSACALLLALVPLVNALTTSRGLLPSLLTGDRVFAAFDLSMLAFAAAFASAARQAAIARGTRKRGRGTAAVPGP
ncbi:PepSY-associated TM helix domain-containing protein [Niveispirillum fermenti]|uniref:PepSY-associated TM helix domain-containing protein n=1 Tax=Niveispirillum fermenti TaxID=1233113 RepID=UPI003A866216